VSASTSSTDEPTEVADAAADAGGGIDFSDGAASEGDEEGKSGIATAVSRGTTVRGAAALSPSMPANPSVRARAPASAAAAPAQPASDSMHASRYETPQHRPLVLDSIPEVVRLKLSRALFDPIDSDGILTVVKSVLSLSADQNCRVRVCPDQSGARMNEVFVTVEVLRAQAIDATRYVPSQSTAQC